MANSVATVASLEGQAWAKAPDGTLRPLKVGDTVTAEEVVITATGAHIELDFGDGHPVSIAGGQEVMMNRDLWTDLASDNKDAAVDNASVQEALTVLNNGGDLTTTLEETAAGLSGGGSNEGHSFVELTRVVEETDPNAFNFAIANGDTGGAPTTQASAASVNNAPIVTDQGFTGNEDTVISGRVIANDVENDVLTYGLVGQPANGTITLDPVTGEFVYTPNGNYNGPDSFVVTVTDDHGNTTTSTVNLTVTAVNDAPVSSNQNLTTPEDTPVSGQVVATDVEGDTLTYTVATTAAHGTVTLNPATGGFVYTPSADYNGSDSFVVSIADGNGGVTTSTITIGVTPVNDAPVSNNQNLTTPEDTPISGSVIATDVDGDTLAYSVTSTSTHGTVTLDPATGAFVYTPNANYNGSDSFVVTIADGQGGVTTSTINIGVTPVNDAPGASDQNLTTPEDTAISGQVVATDVEGDTLSYSVTTTAAHGTVTLDPVTGGFVYTPSANYNGADQFVVTVSDGNGGLTTSAIHIGVTPLNDAPVSADQNLITPEDTAISGQVVATDGDGDVLTYAVTSNAANGSVTIDAAIGDFVYTPNSNYNGSDSFTVTIDDGKGGLTTSVINIGVTPLNDAPASGNQNLSTPEDTPLNGAISASDPDGDTLSFTVSGNPANGSVVVNPATGGFTYTPNSGYNGNDSFVVTVNDGHGGTTTSTVIVGVQSPAPVNAAPTAVNDVATTDESTAVTVAVRGNDTDPDGDILTVSGVTQGANGSVVIDGITGNPIYTPNSGYTGSDSFTYTVNDGNGHTSTATVNVTVNAIVPANQAPVAVADSFTVAEGGTATILIGGATSVLANDTDADGNPLTAVLVTGPANGTLTLNANGTFSYTHNGGETTTDSFTYRANDGTVNGNIVTVNIGVTPVNDAPVNSVPAAQSLNENGALVFNAGNGNLISVGDVDAGSSNIQVTLTATHGTIDLSGTSGLSFVVGSGAGDITMTFSGTQADINNALNGLTYTPTGGYNGSAALQITTDDLGNTGSGGAKTDTDTIALTVVSAGNHLPVAVVDSISVAEGGTATILVGGAASVLANDTDADGDPLTSILVSGPTNGTLTLNADGTFSYTHNGSETTTDSFTYKVNDGTVDGNTVTVNIGVTPVNDAPVAVADSINVTEGGTATILVGGATSVLTNDSDVDGDPLNAILVSGPANGALTLNADGTFSYTHNGSETTSDSFTYKVNDGTVDGNTVTVNIGVTPVNDAPIANNDIATTDEATSVTVAVRGNDTDAENDSLTVSAVTQGANGSVVIDGVTGNPIYTPNASFTGNDSFTYTINDGNGGTSTATVSVTVNPVNHAPVAVADSFIVAEGGTATTLTGGATSLLANDTDADGNPLTAILVAGPVNGNLVLNADGTFNYIHNGSETTTDSFTYKVNDGTVDGNTVTVNINVTPVNDAPVAVTDSITVAEGGTATVLIGGGTSVLANDLDAEGNALNAILVTGPANGTLTLNADGTFSYTHNGTETTSDSFTYKVNDGTVDGNTVTVNIGVTPVNDAPVGVADSISVAEGGTATILVGGAASVLANDTDAENDTLSSNLVTGPAHGTLTLNANGTFSYTHDGSETTIDSFTYKVNDGSVDGNIVTVNIGVTPVNDIPVSSDQNLTTPEDTPLIGAVVASDADGDPLAYNVTTTAAHGSLFVNPTTGSFTYTPDTDYNGPDSFVVTISDGQGGTTTSQINIGVTPVNDAPVGVADNISVAEGGTATILVGGAASVLANDTDAENDTLSSILVTGPAHGTLTLNANGTFSYTHDGSETTTDSFTYKVNDGSVDGNIVTVNIGVTPVNDAPVSSDQNLTTPEDTPLTGTVVASDADGDPLAYNVTTTAAHGSLFVNPTTGAFTYTPDTDYKGPDSFVVTISDGQGGTTTSQINIGVTPVNDTPIAVADNISVAEGGTATVLVGGASSLLSNDSDVDGDTLNAVLVAGPTNGTLTLNANGTFSYTHDGSQTISDSFTYKVNDGTVDGNTVTVNIGVIPVNNTPVAVADSITVAEGGTATILVGGATSVLANDTDADGDTLTAVLVSGPSNGTLTLNANGTFSYTHNGGETTTDSFTYKVNDGSVEGNTVTVNIGVTPVNDTPVAVADSIIVAEGGTTTILVGGATSVLANDSDAENNTLGSILVAGPVNGTLTLNANGTFSYTHNGSETTSDSFTYKVNDGTVDGNTVTVNIGVTPVNDAPIANNDTAATNEGAPVTIAVRGNDTDVEGNGLTVVSVTQGANGSVILDSITGNPIYTPNLGFNGSDTFTYTINDGNGGTATASVNVAVNAAPQSDALVITGNEDTAITVVLSGSDSDGSLTGFVIKSLPVNGILYGDAALTAPITVGDLVTGSVYFMPNANWNGSTNFNYAARDNVGLEDPTPATVNITVTPVADIAVLGTGSGSVKEDTPAQSSTSGTLSIVDPDAGEAAFAAQTNTAGTYGSFSVNSAGSWTYNIDNTKPSVQVLKEGEIKTEGFTVTSIDGTSTTVTVTVIGANDAPIALVDTANVNQDAILTLTPVQLLGNDTDPDGDVLTINSVQDAVHGTVSLVGGNAVFTPTSAYYGPASFTYTVTDGHGGTATANVNITVIKPNTPPDAVNDSAVPATSTSTGFYSEYFGYNEGTNGANLTSVQQIFSFINGRTPDATFTAKLFDYGANFAAGNDLGYSNNLQNFLGTDAASLSADPATTSDAIIRMRGFVNLNAGSYNFKVLADDGYQILVDGVVIAERNLNQASTTTVHNQFTLASSGMHYVEIIYWDQGGYARLKVELSDNAGATYNLISTVPNYSTSVFAAVEDTPLNIAAASLLTNDTDADGDTLTITGVQGAVNGTVSLVSGNVVFTPTANYAGPASFTYTISDGKGGTDTATVNLNVAPVNDAPIAIANSAIAGMNTALTIPTATLLANDSDIDGDAISIVSVQNPSNGTVSLSGSNVIFTPTNNFEGAASFTYTIRDNAGATGTATVNVSVGSASAPSLVVSKSLLAVAHGTGGTSVKFPVITSLVDTDGSESLSIKISSVPTGLSFNTGTDLGGGVWQFTTADLSNLTLNVPGSYTTLSSNLTVQVTSTEVNGGATASTSSVVTLKAAYTTVDITTTDSGSYTGTSANEYIQGGIGNNVINASSGNNIVNGGSGDDNLSAAAGSDIFFGGSGNDTIDAGSGTDRISGGSGNDTLKGGDVGESFVDVFAWSLGDQGAAGTPAIDTIQNFSTAAAGSSTNGGDVLDLRDLLQGESVGPANGAGNLVNYLHFEVSGGNTIVHISHAGGFSADSHTVSASYTSGAETQQIVLSGVNLQTFYSGATTDQQIITQLLNNNKLITD